MENIENTMALETAAEELQTVVENPIDDVIGKLAETAVEAPTPVEKDYVTYTITADEIKVLSVFEADEFKSKKRETLYTGLHRLIGDKVRNFELGGVVASNGAIDKDEPLTIVYRRPLKTNERITDFEEDRISDGMVTETAHLSLASSMGRRLFYAATIFAPLYNALSSQYTIRHIYNMASRLAETVIVGDPSTYLSIDQNIGNGVRHEDEEFTVYRMFYAGMAQTKDILTRVPAIVAFRVYETDVSSNVAEIFPVVRCGNRIGFNTYLAFDCVFEEPKLRVNRTEEELEVEDVSISEMLTFVSTEKATEHVNRKTGAII